MREVEVKARVKDFVVLKQKLEALGCKFSEPISQKDRIFIPAGHNVPVDPGVNVLRIREQNGEYIFTLKQAVANQLDCVEKELKIDNPEEMAEICRLLGFVEDSQVAKIRRKAKYNGLEICLDAVDRLGSFIEVEKMTDNEHSEAVQKELFAFLETLGVVPEDQVFEGYDVMIKNTSH